MAVEENSPDVESIKEVADGEDFPAKVAAAILRQHPDIEDGSKNDKNIEQDSAKPWL